MSYSGLRRIHPTLTLSWLPLPVYRYSSRRTLRSSDTDDISSPDELSSISDRESLSVLSSARCGLSVQREVDDGNNSVERQLRDRSVSTVRVGKVGVSILTRQAKM